MYHSLSEKEVIEKFDSNFNGLTNIKASENLKKFGENRLKKLKRLNTAPFQKVGCELLEFLVKKN